MVDVRINLVAENVFPKVWGLARFIIVSMVSILACHAVCGATTYTITASQSPDDVYPVLESLQPGDIVEFAPGKYEYRIRFREQSGDYGAPIILRAQDPNNRPVFDLSGDGIWTNSDDDDWVSSWPSNGGSNRAIWEFTNVAYFEVSGIVFRGAHQSRRKEDAAAIRIVANSNYDLFAHHITFRNCLFEENDNGVQGGGDQILYEYCEFRNNGATDIQVINDAQGTHNMYIHGGDLTVRYCHLHDPLRGQNFHLRTKTARFEYNLIENGFNYMGDIMTNTWDRAEGEPITQELTLLGNVIIEKDDPGNDSKVFSFFDDQGWPNTSMRLNLFYNTVIGNGDSSALLRIYDDDNVPLQEAYFYNNIFYNIYRPFNIESGLTSGDYHFEARNNWWPSGYDYSPYASFMSDAIFGTPLGFNNPGANDYSLAEASEVKDVALTTIPGLISPQYEYNPNGLDTNVEMPRASTLSLGAYEYGGNTSTPITDDGGAGSSSDDGGAGSSSDDGGAGGSSDDGGAGGSGGCFVASGLY